MIVSARRLESMPRSLKDNLMHVLRRCSNIVNKNVPVVLCSLDI